MMLAPHHNRQRGFTLVEMVVGMVVTALLMGMIAMILGAPAERYMEQRRRNELVDSSDRFTRVLVEDLGHALPNSVRARNYANVSVLQMIEVTDTAYYVPEPVGATPGQAAEGLRIGANDNQAYGDRFMVYGRFDNVRGSIRPLLVVGHTLLVVGHTGTSPAVNAYSPANTIMNLVPLDLETLPPYSITLDAGFRFTSASPTNRIFAVRAPITYLCNRTTGRLQRFRDHAFSAAIPANESAAQLNSVGTETTTLATGVTACNVACAMGPDFFCRGSSVTLSMTLSRGVAPDTSTVRVVQQAAVENIS